MTEGEEEQIYLLQCRHFLPVLHLFVNNILTLIEIRRQYYSVLRVTSWTRVAQQTEKNGNFKYYDLQHEFILFLKATHSSNPKEDTEQRTGLTAVLMANQQTALTGKQ